MQQAAAPSDAPERSGDEPTSGKYQVAVLPLTLPVSQSQASSLQPPSSRASDPGAVNPQQPEQQQEQEQEQRPQPALELAAAPGESEPEGPGACSRILDRISFFHLSPGAHDPDEWHQSARFLRMWTLLRLLHFLYSVVFMTVRICFRATESDGWWAGDLVADLLAVCDMWVCAHSAFSSAGHWVTDPAHIMRHYLRSSSFLVDVFAVLPVDWVVWAATGSYEPAWRANRILRITYFNEIFQVYEVLNPATSTIKIRLAKSAAMNAAAAHFIGCGFMLVMQLEGGSETLGSDPLHYTPSGGRTIYWQGFFDLFERRVPQQYIRCLYWAFISMTGYGNTIPVRRWETLYTIFITLIGVFVYVHTIATVGSLVQNLQQAAEANRTKVDTINQWMMFRQLPEHIRRKVQEYYKYMWETRKGVDELTLMQDLPVYLRLEVAEHVNKDIIQKVPLFQRVPAAFLKAVILHLQPRVVLAGANICKKGDVGAEMFFISSGEVHVVGEGPKETRPIFATLTDGSFFGEVALIYQTRRTATVVAGSNCELYVLSKMHFDEVLHEFSEYARMILEEAEKRFGAPAPAARAPVPPQGARGTERRGSATGAEGTLSSSVNSGSARPRRQSHVGSGGAGSAGLGSKVR